MIRRALSSLPFIASLAACSTAPASIAEVTEKLRAEFSDDGYEVTWLNVTEKAEAGSFDAIIDRVEGGDPDSEETMICDVKATASSSSWTCQTARPSIMIQAAEMLKKDYDARGIRVLEYNMRRTGSGNGFAGYFVLAAPGGGESLRIPCKGSQDGTDFKIDCDQTFGDTGQADGGAPGNRT